MGALRGLIGERNFGETTRGGREWRSPPSEGEDGSGGESPIGSGETGEA